MASDAQLPSKDVALRLRELADELPTKPVHLGLLQQALRGGAAEIEQLRARVPGNETECVGWQPIETAPKDGSRILAYFDYNPIYRESSERWFIAVVRWTGDYGMWSMPGTGGLSPKLWQPIRYPNDPTLKAKVCQCDPSGQGALPCPVHDSESEGEQQ